MSRIIINNRTSLTDIDAMNMVSDVISVGRISNDEKQYCYLTVFRKSDVEYHVVTDLRKKSDSFTIYNVSEHE